MRDFRKITRAAGAALTMALFWVAASPVSAAQPPTGKTYFVISIGVATDAEEAYQIDVGCMRFTDTEMCSGEPGRLDCGRWWRTDEGARRARRVSFAFEFELIDDETGLPIAIDGQGELDARGPRSSVGGVARGTEPSSGTQINFAMAGRAVGEARCAELVREYEAASG